MFRVSDVSSCIAVTLSKAQPRTPESDRITLVLFTICICIHAVDELPATANPLKSAGAQSLTAACVSAFRQQSQSAPYRRLCTVRVLRRGHVAHLGHGLPADPVTVPHLYRFPRGAVRSRQPSRQLYPAVPLHLSVFGRRQWPVPAYDAPPGPFTGPRHASSVFSPAVCPFLPPCRVQTARHSDPALRDRGGVPGRSEEPAAAATPRARLAELACGPRAAGRFGTGYVPPGPPRTVCVPQWTPGS